MKKFGKLTNKWVQTQTTHTENAYYNACLRYLHDPGKSFYPLGGPQQLWVNKAGYLAHL